MSSVEDRQGASAAPDASHLWLVSDRSTVVQGGRGGGQREGTGSAPCGLRSGGALSVDAWEGWSLLPPPGPSGHCSPGQRRTLLRAQPSPNSQGQVT